MVIKNNIKTNSFEIYKKENTICPLEKMKRLQMYFNGKVIEPNI